MINHIISEGSKLAQKVYKTTDDLEIRGRVETIQTIVLLISARILRIILETEGDLLLLKL